MKTLNMIRLKIVLGLLLIGGFSTYGQEIMTLNKALEIATLNSPDLKITELNLTRSQNNLAAQRAGLKSLFSLTVDPVQYNKGTNFDSFNAQWYNRENFTSGASLGIDQPILPTGGSIWLKDDFYWQYNNSEKWNSQTSSYEPNISRQFYNGLRVGFDQPIFTYNVIKQDLRKIELTYENTLLSYLLQKISLEAQVAAFFYDVYQKQMSVDIAKSELYNNQSSYDIIANKVEGGLAALEELYQAEVNLASSKSSVSTTTVNLENSKDQFKMNVGMDLDIDFLAMTSVEVTPVFVDIKHAQESALNNRMEIRQREIDIENSQFDLIETKNNTNDFNGSISGSIGLSGVNSEFGSMYNYPTQEPNFAITLNIPLYDWGQRKNKIAAAQADIDISEIDLEQEKRDIIINVRQLYRSLDNLRDQIDIAKLNVKNSQLTYDINAERYRNGDITGMDLSLFQEQLSSKKMDLTNALIDYRIELLNLKIQTLYDFELNISIVPEELLTPTETK